MMHDFGVSLTHTVIMDLPLSLDPVMQLTGLNPRSNNSSKLLDFIRRRQLKACDELLKHAKSVFLQQ